MKLATRLGAKKYYDYIELFGLTERTGIDFPGEAYPILVPEKSATTLDLAIMGVGQTNAVTPIQLVTAISAICSLRIGLSEQKFSFSCAEAVSAVIRHNSDIIEILFINVES